MLSIVNGSVGRGRCGSVFEPRNNALSRGDYHWGHEPAWYAVRGTGHWRGDRRQTTVWEVPNLNPFGGTGAADNAVTGHSTQKTRPPL